MAVELNWRLQRLLLYIHRRLLKPPSVKLKELGVKIALDDFGTGYSSLSYLTKFKLHTLEMDRSFIQDLSKDAKVRTITASIIQIAKGLGMEIVAEGVETVCRTCHFEQCKSKDEGS